MSKLAVFDDNGFPTAFYWVGIHDEIAPKHAVEISDDQWLEFIENAGLRRWHNGTVVDYTPSPAVDLKAYAAQKRWEKEVGGIEINGLTVSTDDRSKTMISGARVAAQNNPDFSTQWKSSDGTFATIDAAAVILISDAMLTHVSNCFAIEAQVLAEIEAGTISSFEQIDAAFA